MDKKTLPILFTGLAALFGLLQWIWILPGVKNWMKTIVTILICAIISFVWFREKVYKILLMKVGTFITSILFKLYKFLWNSYSKALYVFVLLCLISLISKNAKIVYLSSIIFLIYLLPLELRRRRLVRAPFFSSGFDRTDSLDQWQVITGDPDIDVPFGIPEPSLRLKTGKTRTDSFLVLNELKNVRNCEIECDIILKPGALVNICFRLQKDNRGYMARLDTRGGDADDSFLRKTGEFDWEHTIHSGEVTTPNDWHHILLKIKDSKFTLFKDDDLILEWEDSEFEKGRIGIFNEQNEVHIDNFMISRVDY